MSNPNKILLGLLGAAVVGVAVGMLLAPEKANEIKRKIADKASDFASSIGDIITSGKEKVSEVGENLAGKARTFGDEFSKRAENTKNNMA